MNTRRFASTAAFVTVTVLATLATAFQSHALAAELPTSVLGLFDRVPDPPRTAQEAATWVDLQGKLVHPGLLSLKADIVRHQQQMAQFAQTVAARERAQAGRTVADLGQGMADIGIDMARMQRDPAYAQQVQERMRRLSPQEMLALAQRMNQPLNQDPQRVNEAQAMAADAPAVRAAAEVGEAYAHAAGSRVQAHHAAWQANEAEVARLAQQPLRAAPTPPSPEWENIGCNPGCRAQWQDYAARMLPLLVERDTQILRLRVQALQRQRAAVAAELKQAEQHLQATQYGQLSVSTVNQNRLIGYDAAAVGEVLHLIDRIVDTAARAAVVTHCGAQAVLVPGAVCH